MTRHNVAPQGDHVLDGYYDPQTGDLRIQLGLPVQMEGTVNCAFGMDGSASMGEHYKHKGWGPIKASSEVETFIHKTGAFVAQLDSDHGVAVYLWATGDGRQVADLGTHGEGELEKLVIKTSIDGGDIRLGQGTFLRPALDQIVREVCVESGAGMTYIVMCTDGKLADYDDVCRWTTEKAKAIAAGSHPPFKIILVGFDDANPVQMEGLDNLDTGTDVDIFDAQDAGNLEGAAQHLTDEALTSAFTVAAGGYLEANGVKFPFEGGVPQRIDTQVTPGLKAITLVIEEGGAEVDRLSINLPG